MKTHDSEVSLCSAAIEVCKKQGWTAYTETCGFDIVFVGHGFTVGVEAKLKQNLKVLLQADERSRKTNVPDFIAVLTSGNLVFQKQADFNRLCNGLGFISWQIPINGEGTPLLNLINESFRLAGDPLKIPEYVSDVPAGASGPVQLTEWKISALKIFAAVELRGSVSRADFKKLKLDYRRWPLNKWLEVRDGVFIKGKNFDKIPHQHPEVYEKIKSDLAKKSIIG